MKAIKLFFACSLCVVLLYGCSNNSSKSKNDSKNKVEKIEKETESKDESTWIFKKNILKIIVSENKDALKAYYDLPHLKEFYGWRDMSYSSQPEINYPEDLTTLSYGDLRLLRNEILARNGYLFNDGFLRGYFNRFKWYMPIFGVDTIKVIINKKEENLVNAIIREESKRKENKKISQNDLQLYNADLVVNSKQFTEVHSKVSDDLKKQNFSIVMANRSMPFYVYDKNAYQYIPHYITTDLYLFILHKYFSRFVEKLDENFLSNELFDILHKTASEITEIKETNPNNELLSALEWAQMYVAIALYASGDSLTTAPGKYNAVFMEETQNIDSINGKPAFIKNRFVSYTELKPRGHYTNSDKLKKYFKGFKWISLNGINLYDDEQLKGMIVLAHGIKNDTEIFQQYKRYIQIIEKLAGQEDNLSLSDIITALPDKSIDEVITDKYVKSVRNQLDQLNKERIKIVFGESFKVPEGTIKRVYFLSSTYSISGEIFSKLVHVDWLNSKRPFPKGLDVPAVFGNKTAEDILINEYKENESWTDYLKRLNELQNQFRDFNNWNHNYGFKGVQTALASFAEQDNYPDFMKTDSYNRKELGTALASWTHIKHDLILYQEKPFAAEMGQGGGGPEPNPPQHYSYVEPNLLFWDSALELVEWLEYLSKFESTYEDEFRRIKELGERLKNVAYKQINGEEVTRKEYNELLYVGGTIEYILFGLLETDHLPDRESSMALIADVYLYNDENLNVAVGHADDIYVVVPIKGEYYIARGATFSYYEFKGKIYNDEQWRSIVGDKKEPDRPEWLKSILNRIPPLKGQMQYRFERD